MARHPALASLLVALACACTTSFEADQLRARPDATLDAADATPDLGDGSDASPDVASACGGENAPCCESGAAPSPCNAGLVCQGGVCARCAPGRTACGGFCVDTDINVSHCGACGNVCPEGYSCSGGGCLLSCATGLTVCGAVCAQTGSDPMHCGRCRAPCTYANATGTCTGGVCAFGRCGAGFGDCDSDTSNGCETNTRTDVNNCGACGVRCAPTRASAAVCDAGVCRVVTCAAGYGDCDQDASNGCEVDLSTNAANCGACDTLCSAGGACVAGVCRVSTSACAAGTADCVAATAGCETSTATDLANCGACGNACSLPHATSTCAMGACAVASCAAGFADCDAMADSGCEADTRTSLADCGACGRACAPANATGVCAMGACAIGACNAGFADCNRDAADGCEVDLRTSATNCGACASACNAANGVGACVAGRCAVGTCNAGFADCDGNASNGCEVNTQTSAANCSACGAMCAFANATATCAGATCGLGPCATGFADCDRNPANGCEAAVNSDPRNCGGCGRICSSGQVCSASECRSGCTSGTTLCGSSCVNAQSDARNCGACGNQCSVRPLSHATPVCRSAVCGYACTQNYLDCNAQGGDGCEVNIGTDANNCGACGRRCTGGPNVFVVGCAMGTCRLSCNLGWADCDRAAANGCEVFQGNDRNNCGSCGHRCATGQTCALGFCV